MSYRDRKTGRDQPLSLKRAWTVEANTPTPVPPEVTTTVHVHKAEHPPAQQNSLTLGFSRRIHIMARLSFDPLAPQARTQSANPLADLDRLLGRLQQTILRADAERERRLRNSEFERQKLAFVGADPRPTQRSEKTSG